MSDTIVISAAPGGDRAAAKALSERTGIVYSDVPGDALTLFYDRDGVCLSGFGMSFRGDFTAMIRRVTGGRLPHEMLAHLSRTSAAHPTAIDATAGMGEDALLFAACGYDVRLFERNPVIAALLRDALCRAKKCPELCDIVDRMHLTEGDSIGYLSSLNEAPDLIYLDPMFPARQKSGLINKKLQLIQHLEQPCVDEDLLLSAAIGAHPKKIIIKRPAKGAPLAGKKPHYTVFGKAIRYDCFSFT